MKQYVHTKRCSFLMALRLFLLVMGITIAAAVPACAEVYLNAICFPDETFRHYLKTEKFPDLKWMNLSDAQLASVKEIDIKVEDYPDIETLEGIKYFTNLEKLVVYGESKLTALDLTSNKKLKEVRVGKTGLTSLKISGLNKLEKLSCAENTSLKTLDVTTNTQLQTLQCYKSGLTSLNTANNQMLSYLSVWQCPITKLDISNNTGLKALYCEETAMTGTLSIQNNPYLIEGVTSDKAVIDSTGTVIYYSGTGGDASGVFRVPKEVTVSLGSSDLIPINPITFPDDKLRALIRSEYDSGEKTGILTKAEREAVSEFDCSGKGVASLKGIDVFTKIGALNCTKNAIKVWDPGTLNKTFLKTIQCGSNQLTTLDVSSYTYLTGLDASNNKLTALDVSHNPSLNVLMCNGNSLTTLDIRNCTELEKTYAEGTEDAHLSSAMRNYTLGSSVLYFDFGVKLSCDRKRETGGSTDGSSGGTGTSDNKDSKETAEGQSEKTTSGETEKTTVVKKRKTTEISPENPASLSAVIKKVKAARKEKAEVAGSTYSLLKVRGYQKGKKKIRLKWTEVEGAESYQIYGGKCGPKYKIKKLATVEDAFTYTYKKCKEARYYRFIVVAVKGKKALAVSKKVHVITKGASSGNPKSVTLNATKKTLKRKKTFKLKATLKTGGMKVKKHSKYKIAYESDNISVATVTAKGVIKGIGKGTCYIYAYAQNGAASRIRVTVK